MTEASDLASQHYPYLQSSELLGSKTSAGVVIDRSFACTFFITVFEYDSFYSGDT